MSKESKEYQQQILFNDVAQPFDNKSESVGQVVFDASTEFEVDTSTDVQHIGESSVVLPGEYKSSNKSLLLRLGVGALTVAVVLELIDFFVSGFQTSPILTSLYAVGLVSVSFVGLRAMFGEWMSLGRLKTQQHMQAEATRLLQSQQAGEAEQFCSAVSETLPEDLSNLVETDWYEKFSKTHTDAEIVKLYSQTVLQQIDKRAHGIIAKHASESALLVTLSPLALMDMLIVLWRNFAMIDQLAALYGMRLGYRARIRLVKQVFTNAIFAAGSEIILDFGLEHIGAELGGKLAGSIAQGLASGLLTARLGINTLKICRPIPFNRDEIPKIKTIRKTILSDLTRLIRGSKTSDKSAN